jgi:hypothetical protein
MLPIYFFVLPEEILEYGFRVGLVLSKFSPHLYYSTFLELTPLIKVLILGYGNIGNGKAIIYSQSLGF